MVYKKYIKRNGKIFGPYYYESYRDKKGKVKTRFISGPKKSDKLKKRIQKNFKFIIFSFFIIFFLLLLIGNLEYYLKIVGKTIYDADEKKDFSDISISEKISENKLHSNINLRKEVSLKIKRPVSGKKEIIEFKTPEGKIISDIDLLDSSVFNEKGIEQEIELKNFSINLNKNSKDYKWGYQFRLNNSNFIARIKIKSKKDIKIIDSQTLKIGNNYLNFFDLVKQNYTISILYPKLLKGTNLSNVFELNWTKLRTNQTKLKTGYGKEQEAYGKTKSNDFIDAYGDTFPYGGAGKVIKIYKDNFDLKKEIQQFFARGLGWIKNLFIKKEKFVFVYVKKDFTKTKYDAGDLINLDPVLVRFIKELPEVFKDDSEYKELPLIKKTLKYNCISNWECKDWSKCEINYNFDKITENKKLLDAEKSRLCIDKNNCNYNKIEKEKCKTKIPVSAKKVKKCFKNYIEIYDLNNTLISRLELVNKSYKTLNIQMLFDEFGYCPYCYDGIKNYDENNVDCSYNGKNCPICTEKIFYLKQKYNIWTFYIMLILLVLFFLIWYIILFKKNQKKIKKILKISDFRFIKKINNIKSKRKKLKSKHLKKESGKNNKKIQKNFIDYKNRLKKLKKRLNEIDKDKLNKETKEIEAKLDKDIKEIEKKNNFY